MTSDSEDLDALAADQITELFGWSVSLLDAIREVRDLAHRGGIDIHEWRRRDGELRASGPSQYPRDQVKAVHDAALDALLDRRDGGEARDRIQRLIRWLNAVLHGTPDDEQLRRELAETDYMLRTEQHRGVRTRMQEERELIVRWLAASSGLDDETGLPWDYLARYRWIPDPMLG